MDRQNTISRRQTLIGIGLAGATAAVPVAGASIAKTATQPDRSTWNRAVARLKTAEEEYERIDAHTSAAHDAAEAACPRRDEFFRRYDLGCGVSRERNFRAAHMSIVNERAKGRHMTPEEAKQATADAYRVVDDFETWCARRDEAFREHSAWEKRFDAAVDERASAQEAVLATDAPDHECLLFKIELLARMLEEADAEDAERVSTVRKDARRLLTNGRA